jgi:hypothetical protein
MADKRAKAKAPDRPPPDPDEDSAEEMPPQAPPAPPPPQVSVPAKASCLTFVVLLLAEFITLLVLIFGDSQNMSLFDWRWRILVITLLVFIVPIVVYRATALWLFDESARYPDIAGAWRAGLAELERQGMSLYSAPLFLILGTGSDKLRRSFMNAAEGDYRVDGGADSAAPLYWYANDEGIFLYLNDVCWMNAAITLYEMHAEAVKSGRQMPGETPREPAAGRKVGRYFGTIMPDVRGAVAPSRRVELPSDVGATVEFNPPAVGNRGERKAAEPAPANMPTGGQYFETLTPEQVVARPVASGGKGSAADSRSTSVATQRVSNRLSSQESSRQLQRLEAVCGLLRRNRHPVCPANGILTLLPFEMLKAGAQDVAELERAISADLLTIYRELQLRCPVTAVVVGMEQERGFRELVRRIGREGATKQRFGQRFDLRTPASEEELRKFTTHVCGTFEDWVYTLFREDQALSHPGNTALYALLCKVRRTLKARLGDILGKGFGSDRKSEAAPILFSGCYFTATGPKADRQAFVSGLLSKLYDEQEDIEWTPDALYENERRGWLTRIGWVVCAAILLCIAGVVIWKSLLAE